MKERPISFNGEMVRAILDGRKTQTRRPVKPQPWCPVTDVSVNQKTGVISSTDNNGKRHTGRKACPYGTVGDRLWVRETFCNIDGDVEYRATYGDNMAVPVAWTPSSQMPRWASRITLEITGVRVERVQDIADFDAFQEGVKSNPGTITGPYCQSYVQGFHDLWQSIYGTWDENPWVWVVEFKRVEGKR